MSSITIGVGALVAINSFRSNALDSVDNESRAILGADLRLSSNRPFPKPVDLMVDSAASRYMIARVTGLVSMGVSARTGDTRLVQVRAIEPGYPFYGSIATQPANEWQALQRGRRAIVDRGVLLDLGLSIGDTLLLGDAAFVIAAYLEKSPADFSFRNIIGPRVYIAARDLESTGLLGFGSLAQYQAYYKAPDRKDLQRYVDRRHDAFRKNLIDFDTADEQGESIAKALSTLTRFLGLAGLAALLLGGIGVATAVHVFVKDKRPVIAVLRCIGANERTVFAAYLLQAGALATAGAILGVLLGFAIQALLPQVMSALIPFDVPFAIDGSSVLTGIGIGLLVAVLFALIPLLTIRGISPLQALRVEYESRARRFDVYRLFALGVLIAVILALSIWQANSERAGAAFAGALAVTLFVLWLVAWTLIRAARKLVSRRARFPVRQGIANLYRPHNQTVSVTLSLGFGVFVIATMLSLQSNLLAWLQVESQDNAPNVLAFDIQKDQIAAVADVLRRHRADAPSFTPIVPAKITALNGKSIEYLATHSEARSIEPWALRREYRNTYRDTTVASEKVVAGSWFDSRARPSGIVPISMEQEVARDLNLKLGDIVSWDFQGVRIDSRITSLRSVDWARFNTNFFVVFPTGVLESAPQTYVALARVLDPVQRAQLQRDLVARNPNVSVVDLANVRETLDRMLDKVTLAIRFMALFSIMAGIVVLIGAVATARFQRLRESALLKTLGASRSQIMQALITEFAALGTLAAATGIFLGAIASWLLTRFLFKLDFHLPAAGLALLWLGVGLLAIVIGLLNSRDVFRRAPLAVLREITQ